MLAVPMLLAAPEASAQSKVAVIDLRRAVFETEEGLRVQANLKKLFDQRQVDLDSKQRALQQDRDQLEKDAQAGKTPKEALQKRAENLQRQYGEIQALQVDYQREMQRKESEMTNPIVTRIHGLIRRVASQDGYEIILDKPAVPYFRSDLEITDKVIQMYNGGQAGDAPPNPKAPAAAPAPAKPPAKK